MENSKKAYFLIAVLLVIIAVIVYNNIKVLTTNYVGVYFIKTASNQGEQLIPVDRVVSKGENPFKIAIVELLKGPAKSEKRHGYSSEIPATTVLLGIKETPSDYTVNLSEDFGTGGGSLSMLKRLEQLAFTALGASKNKPVYLELNGKRVDSIGGEGTEVPQPLTR
jgi:spore germination protein GerM